MVKLTLVLALVLGHHGGAVYDTARPITLKGTITEFAWTNPHVQIYLDVKTEKGLVHWAVETISAGKLARGSGWTKNSLKAGDEITITLQPAKTGAPVGNLTKIVLANGKELNPVEAPPEY